MLGTFMASLDSSIVNVSLPTMSREFHARIDDIQWVVTAYMLGFCVFMPLTNWLKDRIGFFRLYLMALIIFTTGSLCCGLSHSLDMLVVSRVLQSFGGGAINPTVLSILSTVFPKEERGKAIGWWGIGALLGPALGPTVGGALTQEFGWPSIFFVNVPVCAITIALSFVFLRFLSKAPKVRSAFDLGGFVSLTVFIVGIQYAIARTERSGAGSWEVIGCEVAALIALILFIRKERKAADPIFNLQLFKNKDFVRTQFLTCIRSAALFGGVFLLPFLYQISLGYSELQSGLLLLPQSVMTAIMTPIAGRMADKFGSRNVLLVAITLIAATTYIFAFFVHGTPIWIIIPVVMARGVGMGMLMTPLTTAMVNSVETSQVTMASSINSLTMQLSASLGIALLAVIHQDIQQKSLSRGAQLSEHLALRGGFLVSASIVVLAFIPAWGLPKKQATPPDGHLKAHLSGSTLSSG